MLIIRFPGKDRSHMFVDVFVQSELQNLAEWIQALSFLSLQVSPD